jgi:uncharacterized HAD superfamily protein
MRNGKLVQAQDVLALPGDKVVMRVRLESGTFLSDERNRTVRFLLDGETHSIAVTDREGFAEAVFVPQSPGDYLFRIDIPGDNNGNSWPGTDLLVSCRTADEPITVVDLDGTLMERDWKQVLTSDPEPLAQTREVLTRLAQNRGIIYLTHRPERFGPKSKAWLREHGLPRGPLLLAETDQLIEGSRRYKAERLKDLRSRFHGISMGIGDQISDAMAYHENGMRAILIYHVHDPDDPDDLREQAARLGELPEAVQVVESWREVLALLWHGATYPPRRMEQELLRRAAQLKPRWKLW